MGENSLPRVGSGDFQFYGPVVLSQGHPLGHPVTPELGVKVQAPPHLPGAAAGGQGCRAGGVGHGGEGADHGSVSVALTFK